MRISTEDTPPSPSSTEWVNDALRRLPRVVSRAFDQMDRFRCTRRARIARSYWRNTLLRRKIEQPNSCRLIRAACFGLRDTSSLPSTPLTPSGSDPQANRFAAIWQPKNYYSFDELQGQLFLILSGEKRGRSAPILDRGEALEAT